MNNTIVARKYYNPNADPEPLKKHSLDICNYNFRSDAYSKLPLTGEYGSKDDSFKALMKYYLLNNSYTNRFIFKMLETADSDVEENKRFTYSIYKPSGTSPMHKAILLLHGLNEKKWDKYLPWAETLARKTNSAVILFPIAFHMNRAPAEWSNPKLMIHVAEERKKLFPALTTCTFANTAISHRLQFAPQRLLLSGAQSFFDTVKLIKQIREGAVPVIEKNAELNIFGYSIGVLLAEILLMADPERLFSSSRLFAFCGGAVLDNSNPVSRVILDREAFKEVTRYYSNFAAGHYEGDEIINTLNKQHGKLLESFKIMLHYKKYQKKRKDIFTKLSDRIMSITLKKDRVMPPESVLRVLRGKNIILDFPYTYSHENPFPSSHDNHNSIQQNFEIIMNEASSFLI